MFLMCDIMNYITHSVHFLKLNISFVMFVGPSIRSSVLTPTWNNLCEKRRFLNPFFTLELFQKQYGKLLFGCKISRIMGTGMNTYV